MLCEQLARDTPLVIKPRTGLFFALYNVALDLYSDVKVFIK